METLARLADRLALLADPPGEAYLRVLLQDLGWAADPGRPQFSCGSLTATVRAGTGLASVTVIAANLGCTADLDVDDFPAIEDYDAACERMYEDARTRMHEIAQALSLAPADDLAFDPRPEYADRIRLRSGHWAVTVTVVQDGDDVPILVEVAFSYGADLPGRLAALTGPPADGFRPEWTSVTERIGVGLPPDYRWLIENYGDRSFGGLSLVPPDRLTEPIPGELVGVLRYVTQPTLVVATTADGGTVSSVIEAWGPSGLRVNRGGQVTDLPAGLLHHVVATLAEGTDT